MRLSKNNWARSKMAHFLFLIISIYPFDGVLDKNINFIETFLNLSLVDANPEARQNGRKAFIVW